MKEIFVYSAITLLAIVVLIFAILFVIHDNNEQKNAYKGAAYRAENGAYTFEESIADKGLLKEREGFIQKNKGIDPEKYQKKIKYVNHLEMTGCLLTRKGL